MKQERTDSILKLSFQTAAAVFAGLVGENPALGVFSAETIYHYARATVADYARPFTPP